LGVDSRFLSDEQQSSAPDDCQASYETLTGASLAIWLRVARIFTEARALLMDPATNNRIP
jgi:hypothetical protein